MRALVHFGFVLFCLLTPVAWGQQSSTDDGSDASAEATAEAIADKFGEGVRALNAGRNEEGIAAFKACLELDPNQPTVVYNIACGYAKLGHTDTAFEWLERAAEMGFGNADSTENNIDWTQKDPDLASLRDDPRFGALIERMVEIRAQLEEFQATAEVHIPAALEGQTNIPLLIVLHCVDETKKTALDDRWRAIGDELGMAVVAPSGKLALHATPEQGMAWYHDSESYKLRYWEYERPVADAVSAFRANHDVDKSRIFLAGEGQGGTVAFNVGVGAPGIYKGAVIVDSEVTARPSDQRATHAARMGFRVKFVVADVAMKHDEARALMEEAEEQCRAWGLDASLSTYHWTTEGASPDMNAVLVAAVRALDGKVQNSTTIDEN